MSWWGERRRRRDGRVEHELERQRRREERQARRGEMNEMDLDTGWINLGHGGRMRARRGA